MVSEKVTECRAAGLLLGVIQSKRGRSVNLTAIGSVLLTNHSQQYRSTALWYESSGPTEQKLGTNRRLHEIAAAAAAAAARRLMTSRPV